MSASVTNSAGVFSLLQIRTLSVDAPIAFLTLNPGWWRIDPAHASTSCEIGAAYVHESWNGYPPGNAPLQRQVRSMIDWLGRDPDDTLSAYFVPFRSPSLKELTARRKSFVSRLNCGGHLRGNTRPAGRGASVATWRRASTRSWASQSRPPRRWSGGAT